MVRGVLRLVAQLTCAKIAIKPQNLSDDRDTASLLFRLMKYQSVVISQVSLQILSIIVKLKSEDSQCSQSRRVFV